MSRRKQSRGKCIFCGREMTKGGLTRHFSACSQRQGTIKTAGNKAGKVQQLYHLQVQPDWPSDFWLHLEMKGSATLGNLDDYLRAIWLECCGHLSQFSVGGWRGQEIPIGTRISQVFQPGVTLTHIYDFGTSSETLIKAVGMRSGKSLSPHPIMLMARNNLPVEVCMECDRPASSLCLECMYKIDESGLLCDQHAKTHPHEGYGAPMPLVNSPRVGMCGYDGPAEPPY